MLGCRCSVGRDGSRDFYGEPSCSTATFLVFCVAFSFGHVALLRTTQGNLGGLFEAPCAQLPSVGEYGATRVDGPGSEGIHGAKHVECVEFCGTEPERGLPRRFLRGMGSGRDEGWAKLLWCVRLCV